jgi:hypothetical protein
MLSLNENFCATVPLILVFRSLKKYVCEREGEGTDLSSRTEIKNFPYGI